jgi:uncharacterized protein DUF222
MSTQTELRLIARVSTAVSHLADLDLETLSDPSLLELARRVRQLACRLQSVEIQVVGAIDDRGAAITEGLTSTATWLRSQLRVSDSAARVRCARAVSTMPAVGEAFSAGQISLEHLRAIVRVARDLDPDGHLGATEQVLIDEARTATPAHFAQTAARIRDQLAPDRCPERIGRRRAEPRWLNVRRTVDGAVAVSGRFDREAGDDVIETVEALAGLTGRDDVRPAALRRADALLTLCREATINAATASSSHGRMTNHVSGDRAMTGARGLAAVGPDKAVRPAGRRRLKGRVKRRARR